MFRDNVHRLCALAGVGVVLTLTWGCSSESAATAKFPSARLEGAVLLDGKPIDEGTIQFIPANKEAGPVTQAVILQGRYVAPRVPLGKGSVQIFAKAPEPPANVTSAYQPPKVAQIPERYQKGIPIEVKEDKADFDFDMSSRK